MKKLVVVDDSPEIIETLEFTLKHEKDLSLTRSFSSGIEYYNWLKEADEIPDIVLMDLEMKGWDGITTVKNSKQINQSIRYIMFTVHSEAESMIEALKSGASGYLLKGDDINTIIDTLCNDNNTGAPLSPIMAKKALDELFKIGNIDDNTNTELSKREIEVLQHLSNGSTYQKIADLMNISISTVQSHIKNIYSKLEVNSKSQAVSKAIKNNLI